MATCASCGRRMEPRRGDERLSEPRKYCSSACRSRRVRPVDRALEAATLALLEARSRGATICPSEAARAVAADAGDPSEAAWRELMEPARRAARRLVHAGQVEITQKGRVVDPSDARGPIRVRRVDPR